MKALRRRYGRMRTQPQRFAWDIVRSLQHDQSYPRTPYGIAVRWGLTGSQGSAISNLLPSHFGPGGKGEEALARAVERIVNPRPRRRAS